MKVGIVGLSASGKTTLFRALTRGTVKTESFGVHTGRPNIGVVGVPDRRVDRLVEWEKPKKITRVTIEFIDGAARVESDGGRTKFGSDFFVDVRQVDALVHVVRGFAGPDGAPPSPVRDLQALNDELALADLQLVENRMERVEKQLHGVKKGVTTPATIEMELLERAKGALEEGKSISSIGLLPDEEKSIRGYDLLSLKPLIAVLNIPESELGAPGEDALNFRQHCASAGIPEIELCAQVEMEVSELPDDEEAEFLESLGISQPARSVLIQQCYKALGLISFLTANEQEVRAWTLKAGSKAIDAAGTIHSDLARGFIRAEVANFVDVEKAGGWDLAKDQGIFHLQGKDYVVQDGDLIYVRFKV